METTKILIVEDNGLVAEDYRDSLENFGYIVTSIVASGEESIIKAELDSPDAIVMDIHLRDKMDGIEAAEQISKLYNIPVIFLSAFHDRELLKRAGQIGSYGYLIKPFDEHELYATIEMALYKTRAEQERKVLENRLRRLQKTESLQVMAGSIAHSFNNILQSGLIHIDLALEELPPNSDVQEYMEGTRASITRAAELSKVMLSYLGHTERRPRSLDLTEIILSRIESSQDDFPALNFSHNLKHNDTLILADIEQIDQLIQNTLSNAIESLGDDVGTIVLNTNVSHFDENYLKATYLHDDLSEGEYLVFEISDTGCGMDDDTIANMFDPFFSTKFTGRGLGLAIVQGVVKSHKAAIEVESVPGKGTTVKFLFPVLVDDVPDDKTNSESDYLIG